MAHVAVAEVGAARTLGVASLGRRTTSGVPGRRTLRPVVALACKVTRLAIVLARTAVIAEGT